jgi:hypothetical protein
MGIGQRDQQDDEPKGIARSAQSLGLWILSRQDGPLRYWIALVLLEWWMTGMTHFPTALRHGKIYVFVIDETSQDCVFSYEGAVRKCVICVTAMAERRRWAAPQGKPKWGFCRFCRLCPRKSDQLQISRKWDGKLARSKHQISQKENLKILE